MASEQGYRRIRIRCTQQVLDVPIPVAIARVEGGTAEYVLEEEETKPETKAIPGQVETAAVNPQAERAMKPKPQNRTAAR